MPAPVLSVIIIHDADLVLGCCNTKVQFQHIPQLWLAHIKQSFTMPKTCSSSVSAMKHGRTE